MSCNLNTVEEPILRRQIIARQKALPVKFYADEKPILKDVQE